MVPPLPQPPYKFGMTFGLAREVNHGWGTTAVVGRFVLVEGWAWTVENVLNEIFAFSSNDIKVGSNIEVDGAPWKVIGNAPSCPVFEFFAVEFLHVKPGKGAAYVRTTLRNHVTGNTVEKTFRAGFKNTYEEFRLNESDVGDKKKWIKEGMDCNLLFWKDKVIDFELPTTVKLAVVNVDPGLRGDTVQGGSKPATLETGAIVTVPLFIDVGQEILVDTRTGQYMSRA
ncbi:elongation factor P (EF-P) family protein [Actinidia rufa]|uniref:Elongation factor P (EF-P) family protein n=1 Tax=Actinidia rufa TaxID=165716 RepID=A0A7J0FAK4_9ERIC|nr:elongation factor P (EF-P) family protein [Actinidia rufa]